jgi:hypothetical protein
MTYQQILEALKQEQAQGHIIRWSTDSTPATGIRVFVESDQGWNPEPVWQEFYPESADSWEFL